MNEYYYSEKDFREDKLWINYRRWEETEQMQPGYWESAGWRLCGGGVKIGAC